MLLFNLNNLVEAATQNDEKISFESFLGNTFANMAMRTGGIRGYFGSSDQLVYQDFSNEEIAKVHPNLPGIIQVRFYQQHNPENLLSTNWVLQTLSYWNDPLTLKTTDGRTVALVSINNVKEVYDKTYEVQLDVTKYKLSYDDDTLFVVDTAWTGIFVAFAELEKVYPGWKARYDLLVSLGTDTADLVKEVFNRQCRKLEPLPLHGVDFD